MATSREYACRGRHDACSSVAALIMRLLQVQTVTWVKRIIGGGGDLPPPPNPPAIEGQDHWAPVPPHDSKVIVSVPRTTRSCPSDREGLYSCNDSEANRRILPGSTSQVCFNALIDEMSHGNDISRQQAHVALAPEYNRMRKCAEVHPRRPCLSRFSIVAIVVRLIRTSLVQTLGASRGGPTP